MNELLPCPCCGEEATFEIDRILHTIGCDDYVIIGKVICTECGLGQTIGQEESEAIKDWNYRT